MRRIVLLIFIISSNFISSKSQTSKIPPLIIDKVNQFVTLVKNDRIEEISSLFKYPMGLESPLPNIETPEEFILCYRMLIDSAFKQRLINIKQSDIWERYFTYGLFNGDIWFDSDGSIMRFNYKSPELLRLKQLLTNELIAKAFPTIKPWKKNILAWQTDSILIRIDLMFDNNLRLIVWTKPKNISSEPDFMLFNGEEETHGTMGGEAFTFVDKDKTYIADFIGLCSDPKDCGFFFKVLSNGKIDTTYVCDPIK